MAQWATGSWVTGTKDTGGEWLLRQVAGRRAHTGQVPLMLYYLFIESMRASP